jgi:formate hydrogenlyase transcriptional activator
VVAATNRVLSQMVDKKEFRADLFYRLSVFPILLPPLRDRREDIPSLTQYFIAKYAERMNKRVEHIPSQTMEAMLAYEWPGNIRQLQNFVEHGVIVSQGSVFQPPIGQLSGRKEQLSKTSSGRTLEDATREHILGTLAETKGVVGGRHGAAARLGIARTTLLSKMRRLGIDSATDEIAGRSASSEALASMA